MGSFYSRLICFQVVLRKLYLICFLSTPNQDKLMILFQSDIDRGFLTYAHDDSDTISDSFDVSLFLEGDRSETFGDGRGRTGDLLLCKTTINITVLPKNDRPFRLKPNQTSQGLVKEQAYFQRMRSLISHGCLATICQLLLQPCRANLSC